jgi:hypothetical protein
MSMIGCETSSPDGTKWALAAVAGSLGALCLEKSACCKWHASTMDRDRQLYNEVNWRAGCRKIGTSGSMSGDGKRGVGHRPQATAPVLDSTLQDVDMMGEPVEHGAGEPLRTEYGGPFIERQVLVTSVAPRS